MHLATMALDVLSMSLEASCGFAQGLLKVALVSRKLCLFLVLVVSGHPKSNVYFWHCSGEGFSNLRRDRRASWFSGAASRRERRKVKQTMDISFGWP